MRPRCCPKNLVEHANRNMRRACARTGDGRNGVVALKETWQGVAVVACPCPPTVARHLPSTCRGLAGRKETCHGPPSRRPRRVSPRVPSAAACPCPSGGSAPPPPLTRLRAPPWDCHNALPRCWQARDSYRRRGPAVRGPAEQDRRTRCADGGGEGPRPHAAPPAGVPSSWRPPRPRRAPPPPQNARSRHRGSLPSHRSAEPWTWGGNG